MSGPGVELERRQGVIPVLLVEREAGENRASISACTDKRRHHRELLLLHERDNPVTRSYVVTNSLRQLTILCVN